MAMSLCSSALVTPYSTQGIDYQAAAEMQYSCGSCGTNQTHTCVNRGMTSSMGKFCVGCGHCVISGEEGCVPCTKKREIQKPRGNCGSGCSRAQFCHCCASCSATRRLSSCSPSYRCASFMATLTPSPVPPCRPCGPRASSIKRLIIL